MGFRERLARANLELNTLFKTKNTQILPGGLEKGAQHAKYDPRYVNAFRQIRCIWCSRDISSYAIYCQHCGKKLK